MPSFFIFRFPRFPDAGTGIFDPFNAGYQFNILNTYIFLFFFFKSPEFLDHKIQRNGYDQRDRRRDILVYP